MRHNIKGRKLNRDSAHRKALLANLAKSLVTHEQLRTTLPKAKELKPYADKLITLAKRDSLHTRRQAFAILQDKGLVAKLFDTLGARYKERNGGYTRVLKNGFRFGDSAPMAIIEFVDRDINAKGKEDRARIAAEIDAFEAAEA